MKLRKRIRENTIHMDVRYLILMLFFLASCMPAADVSRGNLASTGTTGGATGGTTGGSGTAAPTVVTWNYLGELAQNITINVSNLNTAYLVGTPLETYLSAAEDFTGQNYCLVATVSIGGFRHELRSRAVPISYYDFKAKRTVRILRIDFQEGSTLEANVPSAEVLCGLPTRVLSTSGSYVADATTPPPSRIHYVPRLICPLCSSMLLSTSVRLFRAEATTLDQVPGSNVNTAALNLQIDPNYSTTGSGGSCSAGECRARGFDCCLENQCVQDRGAKPAAYTTLNALYLTAEQERLQNPLAYLNYPQLYYICPSSVPSTGGGTTGSSSGGYDAAFAQLKKDYNCVQHLKSLATVTPFHTELLSRSYTAAADCLTGAGDAGELFYYQTVVKRLYETCGCNRTELSEMIANCPSYDYTVVTKDAAGEPIRIDCYTPPGSSPSVPANQNVTVSGRAAPHRFFEDGTGAEQTPSDSVTQEGGTFSYLDEGRVLPVQSDYSMNAILGPMNLALDRAQPAKAVAVELDQVYLISTTSGFYTPCPTCGKDSWFTAFTAFPSSARGAGLQAIGHTTERDAFGTNTTAGNYEDTIFGRACWVPPTMLPFAHAARETVRDQRRNRLETQAVLFANGYQRDWFGFNKGALIGSFDGVRWFAIGKGRIVKSTSKRLFLAINAPFADLATPTTHAVQVAAYDGVSLAAQVDYDPQYHQHHPYQNEAGNCQRYHLCESDTDCVTRLGWEYMCADVKDVKTNWPSFDADGNEVANSSTSVTIDQILQQKKFPSTSTRRCVYRGAGAVCHRNSETLRADLNKTKLLTCAPNFYCAPVTGGGHNSKVARYGAPLEEIPVARNHFFGKDANVLGRPHDYLGSALLPSAVRNTVSENVAPFEPTLATRTGLCQPGIALPAQTNQTALADPFVQHGAPDPTRRADYINQIASCNAGLFSDNRHASCPVLDANGNYEMFTTAGLIAGYASRATTQNACGLESLLPTASLTSTADNLMSSSPFRQIEARPLSSQIIVDPTLVRDACLRRAGAACHTDLDCSPNKLHAAQTDLFGNTFFGNAAEKSYWSESLVCGQADPKPAITDTEAFKNYDMSKNTCCREIGKDLTSYTADLPLGTAGGSYDPATRDLRMSVHPGISPNHARRYSRYATVSGIGSTDRPPLSAFQDRSGGLLGTNSFGVNVRTGKQWATLSEANGDTCCGGGWVRKFSDGSNDWSRRNRLVLDVTNFRCINSRTPLLTDPEIVGAQYSANVTALAQLDNSHYCKDPTNTTSSCAQYSILDSALDVLPSGPVPYGTITVNTVTPSFSSTNNPDFYFVPRSADADSSVVIDLSNTSPTARRNIALQIPSYVTYNFEANVGSGTFIQIERDDATPTRFNCAYDAAFSPTATTTIHSTNPAACHYSYDFTNRILRVGITSGLNTGTRKLGVRFETITSGSGIVTRFRPGTSFFYLKRLGLLELSGVPQISFEELTCTDNVDRIVPGIFTPTVTTTAQFRAASFSWVSSYTARTSSGGSYTASGNFTNMHGLQHEPIFSANDFKCCSPLGKVVTDATRCCSGFGTNFGTNGTRKTCALPPGTDLMVYFNRFITNEGVGDDKPGGGLLEGDFDTLTGEPVTVAAVNDKIRALGEAYCASGKVRQGGAFGRYEPEPVSSETNLTARIYNIVDSARDIGQNPNAGKTVETGYNSFMNGFRWNHHLYCDD
jgi:hypothetical protein